MHPSRSRFASLPTRTLRGSKRLHASACYFVDHRVWSVVVSRPEVNFACDLARPCEALGPSSPTRGDNATLEVAARRATLVMGVGKRPRTVPCLGDGRDRRIAPIECRGVITTAGPVSVNCSFERLASGLWRAHQGTTSAGSAFPRLPLEARSEPFGAMPSVADSPSHGGPSPKGRSPPPAQHRDAPAAAAAAAAQRRRLRSPSAPTPDVWDVVLEDRRARRRPAPSAEQAREQ